jgi:hypothetical protein
MAKIHIAPQKFSKFKEYNWVFNLSLCIAILVTIAILAYVVTEYKRQFSVFERLKQGYSDNLSVKDLKVDKPIKKQVDIEVIDKVMQSRPEYVSFDRIRLSESVSLQIEGITKKPEDVESIVQSTKVLGLNLQINQVQQDSEQKIIFELKQL